MIQKNGNWPEGQSHLGKQHSELENASLNLTLTLVILDLPNSFTSVILYKLKICVIYKHFHIYDLILLETFYIHTPV